ncbi:MAG: hypothetical protein NTX55_00690 [Candidatus Parcubacteria bacterium]|nr:hypothetical protein [Candidatus Parcubacteria bacterium]
MNGDVQFKEEWRPQQIVPQKSWGEKLAEVLVKYSGGLIKDEQQASYVILVFVIVAIIVSLFLFFNAIRSPSPPSADKIIKVAGPR